MTLDLLGIGLIALAFAIWLISLDRQREDHEEQKHYRETWTWPPK